MISIQTNVNSMLAQENLRINNQFQTRTIQQLTSGFRINSSGDDAAGLAVANQFRSQTAELTQGVRNANDGISQLQIMDGGLSNISTMLDRLHTLATQSASGTFTGDRTTLNNEYQSLMTEIDRQADNIGLGANNTINAKNIAVYIGGGQNATTNSNVNVNLTGSSVDSISLGLNQTNILTNAAVRVGKTAPATVVIAGDTATFNVNTASGSTQIVITGQANDTLQGQINQLNAKLQPLGITASLDAAQHLQFTSANAFSVNAIAAGAGGAANLVDIVNESALNTGMNNFQYTSATATHVGITVNGVTAVAAIATPGAPVQADIDNINAALRAQGISTVTAVLDATTATNIDFESAQGTSFTVSDDTATPGALVDLANPNSTAALVGADPSAAIDAIAKALKFLGSTQGKVGAGENDLNYAINLAQSQITNFSSAESQIRDADVALEASNLTKAQVLQQSSIAAMAQANSAPQAILKLLQ